MYLRFVGCKWSCCRLMSMVWWNQTHCLAPETAHHKHTWPVRTTTTGAASSRRYLHILHSVHEELSSTQLIESSRNHPMSSRRTWTIRPNQMSQRATMSTNRLASKSCVSLLATGRMMMFWTVQRKKAGNRMRWSAERFDNSLQHKANILSCNVRSIWWWSKSC